MLLCHGLRLRGSVGSCWRLLAREGEGERSRREKLRGETQTDGVRGSGAAEMERDGFCDKGSKPETESAYCAKDVAV